MSSKGQEGTFTELKERNAKTEEEKPLVASEDQVNVDTSVLEQDEARLEDEFDHEFWVSVSSG